ncbi:MAG: hypothetical protein M1816_003633 [Peltula sp. TS41687]|nr:MAG: hypothetical protein M1816_003633 [Peltula sp. TS41687]
MSPWSLSSRYPINNNTTESFEASDHAPSPSPADLPSPCSTFLPSPRSAYFLLNPSTQTLATKPSGQALSPSADSMQWEEEEPSQGPSAAGGAPLHLRRQPKMDQLRQQVEKPPLQQPLPPFDYTAIALAIEPSTKTIQQREDEKGEKEQLGGGNGAGAGAGAGPNDKNNNNNNVGDVGNNLEELTKYRLDIARFMLNEALFERRVDVAEWILEKRMQWGEELRQIQENEQHQAQQQAQHQQHQQQQQQGKDQDDDTFMIGSESDPDPAVDLMELTE